MKSVHEVLEHLREQRDALLGRIVQVLEADPRVTAVWLSGSFGRDEADEWSDLDLHVAVENEHLPEILDNHQSLFAQCGKPLLIIGGVLSDSMPGGHFWLVQYAPYMLEVDWNIGPIQEVVRPQASRLLFDHSGIATTPPLTPADDEQRRVEAIKQLSFFWAMAPIAIKFAGRGHTRLAVKQLVLLEDAFVKLWYVLWRPERLQKETYQQNRPLDPGLDARLPRFQPLINPVSSLSVIRSLCHEVEKLHPALAELGASVSDDVVQEIAALAALAETVAKAGGSAPNRGSRR